MLQKILNNFNVIEIKSLEGFFKSLCKCIYIHRYYIGFLVQKPIIFCYIITTKKNAYV